tara:strand:+ start:412 stop:765 length:354 start_codon:yes stop_codon:yes gene_type:complete
MHPAIEKAVREEIGKRRGDLTKGDFEHLRQLHLSSNQISDVAPLVESLKDLTQLTGLDLCNNQISDVTPLKDLTQLTTLHLNDNQISESDIEDLQEALPYCIISGAPRSDPDLDCLC